MSRDEGSKLQGQHTQALRESRRPLPLEQRGRQQVAGDEGSGVGWDSGICRWW